MFFQDTWIPRHSQYHGDGYVGGALPPDPNPDDLDGRAKILNVPSRVRIVVLDRRSLFCVASTLSGLDGTWSITGLNRAYQYMVLGYDGPGTVNAAIQDCVTPAEME